MTSSYNIRLPQDTSWALDNFKATVRQLAETYHLKALLEIGAGRFPLFSISEVNECGMTYAINDISSEELALADDYYRKLHFDIGGSIDSSLHGQFDLIFSNMVFEHLKSTHQAYTNIFRLLSPGGIAINLHPTLYSSPFVINKLLPECASSVILSLFFKHRNIHQKPKFPAHYDLCTSLDSTKSKIQEIGFSEVYIHPFYGHAYYKRMPIIASISRKISNFAMRNEIRLLSSYAYTVVRK